MVLDAKMMSWAGQNGIDTAKLKAAKVPIYGKWYFPQVPANVALINLESGERRTFSEPLLAGEVMWVAERDLRRAKLGPFTDAADLPEDADRDVAIAAPPEPLLAMSRAPYDVDLSDSDEHAHGGPLANSALYPPIVLNDNMDPATIHMPMGSLSPLLLGTGIGIALVGVITHPLILLVGLIWCALGVAGWIRVGLVEYRQAHGEHA